MPPLPETKVLRAVVAVLVSLMTSGTVVEVPIAPAPAALAEPPLVFRSKTTAVTA